MNGEWASSTITTYTRLGNEIRLLTNQKPAFAKLTGGFFGAGGFFQKSWLLIGQEPYFFTQPRVSCYRGTSPYPGGFGVLRKPLGRRLSLPFVRVHLAERPRGLLE